MSAEEHISVRIGNGSHRFLGKGAVGLSLAVLLLSGILHATPITSIGESQLQDSKQLAGQGVAFAGTKEAVEPLAAASAQSAYLNAEASVQPAAAACVFSGDCYTAVEVPEPQSLVLVGSGLLSMAGLIRRRMLR